MEPKKRIRPTIMLIVLVLAGLGGYALSLGVIEVSTAAVVGIIALGPKIVESESDGS
jgi:hypothetical protein